MANNERPSSNSDVAEDEEPYVEYEVTSWFGLSFTDLDVVHWLVLSSAEKSSQTLESPTIHPTQPLDYPS
jgi:hypothetical protein